MPLFRSMATLHGASGQPTDRYVNTWYFFKETPVISADHTALGLAIQRFYSVPTLVGATNRSLAEFMNVIALRTDQELEVKTYDMSDLIPRVPVFTQGYEVTGFGVPPLPHEVAVCMSYKGSAVSGVSAARRRGRIYLGPLNTAAVEGSASNGMARPHLNLRATIPLLAQRLKNEVEAAGFDWVVHSPTTGLDARYVIAQVGTDDAFDTQRRRGLLPTSSTYVALT